MKNRAWILLAGIATLVAGVYALNAQQVGWPPPAGTQAFLCVYNASPPTISTGVAAFAQCDSTGKLIVSGGGGGDATAANQTLQITQETLTNTTLGTTASAAATVGSTGDVSAKLRLMTTQLDNINTSIQGPINAGAALIGDVNVRQGGTALSATNGIFTNVLQGNAVLSATNGLYNNLLQGNAVISATNGLFANTLQGNAVLSVSNPTFSRSVAGATGGGTLSSAIAPATPAGVNLKASAGSVFRVFATTIQSTPVYIKFYNSASAPTCGSGTPVGRFMVPAAATAANGAGTNIDIGDMGAAFGTGVGYCVTGALADNDTTAITANNTLVNIVWN